MERAQTDFDHAVEIAPLRIPMNYKLLKAAKSGDTRILDELPGLEQFSSQDSAGQVAITLPDGAATQKNDSNHLLGVTPEGNTALHIVASQGHLELAEKICRRERSLLAAPNTRLDTPLHCAARAGDDKMVSLIIRFAGEDGIEAKRVLLSARNMNEANALHEAAQYDHVHVAQVLMKEEDAGLASMMNGAGMSPLYLAILTESFNVAKALLLSSSWDNASPASYEGPDKKTALHVAVHMSPDIAQDLLRLKPMLAKAVDSSGRIPLHYAASDSRYDMVKLLLEHDPSTAYLSDANGLFPIHIAASMGNFLTVDQILNQCPDTEESLDKEGKNFLHVAFKRRQVYFIKRIIRKRPDLRKLLNEKDNKGNTPLHTAIANSDQGSVNFLLRDKGVSHNIINNHGFTPLDLAYTKEDKGQHFWMNVECCIVMCLVLNKAPSNPQKIDGLKSVDEAKEKPSDDDNIEEKSSLNEDKEIEKELNLSRNLGIFSVLIATVTFAAGFTLPGGYIADDHPGRGTAVLAKEYAFKVFLVSDAFAFTCSIAATFWLMYAGTSIFDRYTRKRILYASARFLWAAFAGMSTAFVTGIYAVLAPSSKSIGILLCIIALGTPLFVHMKANDNLYSFLRTVLIRQGLRQCIWPTVHPHVLKRHRCGLWIAAAAIIVYLSTLGIYALFFLLAML